MGCSLFHCLTSGKVEFISTSIGSAAFFQGAFFREEHIMEACFYSWIDDLFSRGAYGCVFFVIDRRIFFRLEVHSARGAFFFNVDRRTLFTRRDFSSDIFLHGSTTFFFTCKDLSSRLFFHHADRKTFSFGVVGM